MDAPASSERRRGRGTRRPVQYPKGRQLDPSAVDEVRAVLGDAPRRRDLLIEHLHLVQDRFGFLSARHFAALAAEMRLAQAEVYEVATFYAHFDVVKEDEAPPPPLTVRVCDGICCELAGSRALHAALASAVGSGVRVFAAPCMGACDHAPAAMVGRRRIGSASTESISVGDRDRRHDLGTAVVPRLRCLCRGGRLPRSTIRSERGTDRGGRHRGPERRGPARDGRSRFSRDTQVRPDAGGAEAASAGDQCRRGRAGDLQGPVLPRHRSAPGSGRRPDRRARDRGRGALHLPARRVPADARDFARRDRQDRGGRRERRCRDASAARRRSLHLRRRVGDAGKHRRQAGLAPQPPAVSGAARAIRTADADQQRRDSVLDPADPGARGRSGIRRRAGLASIRSPVASTIPA